MSALSRSNATKFWMYLLSMRTLGHSASQLTKKKFATITKSSNSQWTWKLCKKRSIWADSPLEPNRPLSHSLPKWMTKKWKGMPMRGIWKASPIWIRTPAWTTSEPISSKYSTTRGLTTRKRPFSISTRSSSRLWSNRCWIACGTHSSARLINRRMMMRWERRTTPQTIRRVTARTFE